MTQMHQAFSTHLLRYVGIGLISGSIVHATTLGHDYLRTLSFIVFGIALFLGGLYLEHKGNLGKHLLSYVILSIIISLGTGMVSGSTQHYLDGPKAGALLFSLGGWLTYLSIYYRDYRDKLTMKPVILSTMIALLVYVALYAIATQLHIEPHLH